jgi:hypothetical protein
VKNCINHILTPVENNQCKLVDLDPRWVGFYDDDNLILSLIGVTFLCPICKDTKLSVFFRNPIEKINSYKFNLDYAKEHTLWDRDGETFEHLTLRPSIDASREGHWHGFISNGVVQ